MEQNGIITPLNPAHVRQPPSTCPPVRVVCSTCHHAFCARCHMSWHENEPVPCKFCSSSRIAPSTNTTRKLKSHRFEKSLFFNRKGHGQTAESPPVRQSFGKPSTSTPGMIVSESKVVPSEETVSQPLASRSSTSTIPVDGKAEESVLLPEQVDDPRLKEKAAKKRSLASTSNTGKKLRSKLTFSNGHPTTSDNSDGSSLAVGFPPYPPDANLKRCPACLVPIERTEGCAQMMCRSCNHTFCWYCLTSLDDDFLLHHYDRGACKGKLGHSRASIIGHRIYVVSVFTGLTILLFVAAPFAIISIPCLLCAKFSRIRHQKRVRKRHSQNVFPPTSQLSVVSSTEVVKTGEQFEPNSTGHSLTLVGSVSANSYEAPGSILVAEKADIHWSDIGRTALPPGASEIPQTVTPTSSRPKLNGVVST
ncbi:unnamed protein product [Calicophoron daubneyi]|uniref:RING-type domain-containing protein n=1 Tax=Calicophoron daubneyi TaxID=300641 RepID=A0AAV2TKG3_CALDB